MKITVTLSFLLITVLLVISSSLDVRTASAGIGASLDKGGFQTTFVNEPVEFTVTPLDGTPPYTYQWCTQLWASAWSSPLGDIVEVTGATSPTFAFVSSTPGVYSISVKIWDSEGNYSNIVGLPTGIWVTVKELPITPIVLILSPISDSYAAVGNPYAAVPFVFETNASLSWVGYSLDGGANTTGVNGTSIELPVNSESLTLYANDTAGNWAVPVTVYFTVAWNGGTPPEPFPWLPVAAVTVLVAAVVAVAAVVYVKKRRT